MTNLMDVTFEYMKELNETELFLLRAEAIAVNNELIAERRSLSIKEGNKLVPQMRTLFNIIEKADFLMA